MSALSWILRASLVAAVFATVAALGYALASLPAPPAPTLGLNGLERRRALADNSAWRLIEPLVRWLGQRLDPLLAERQRASLRRRIILAGDVAGLVPAELVALCVGSALVGLGVGHLYADKCGSITWVMGFAAGALLPLLQLDSLAQERRRRAQLGLPQVIDLVVLALSAGLDFPGALRQVVSRSSAPRDALVGELGLVLHQLELGKTRSQALWLFAERLPSPTVREFVAAVVQAEQSGSPLAEVLRTQAKASRQRRSEQAEVAAARAGVKMLMPLFLAFGSVMLLGAGPLLLNLVAQLKAV